MIILFDAAVALVMLKIFGDNAVYALGLTALITFLRLSGKISMLCDIVVEAICILCSEEEEEN